MIILVKNPKKNGLVFLGAFILNHPDTCDISVKILTINRCNMFVLQVFGQKKYVRLNNESSPRLQPHLNRQIDRLQVPYFGPEESTTERKSNTQGNVLAIDCLVLRNKLLRRLQEEALPDATPPVNAKYTISAKLMYLLNK